jgi:hypothetical protein
VRPLILPLEMSRGMRLPQERGSIEYSAVTQPLPEFFKNRGTPSSTVAVQSTCV